MATPRALLALLVPAAIVSAGLVAPSSATAATCAYGSGWSAPDRAAADRVIVLVNEHRAKIGAPKLGKASVLAKTAEWKSGHMAARGYFNHSDEGVRVNGGARSPGQRLDDCGYGGGTWGENIAYGQRTPTEVMRGWLDSPGHRRNIENPAFRSIGVGVVASSSGRINWTQMFGDASVVDGRGGGGTGAPAPKPAPKPSPRPTISGGLPVLAPGTTLTGSPRIRARRTVGMKFALRGVRRSRLVVRVRGSRGRRPIAARVHCNGKRVATARGRRGRAAVIARKLPAGRCALMITAGRQAASVTVTMRTG